MMNLPPAVDWLSAAWADAVWRAAWQGAIVIALVWAVCRCVPALPGRLRCWAWRLAYLKILIALLWATPIDLPLLAPPADVVAAAAPSASNESNAAEPMHIAPAAPIADGPPPAAHTDAPYLSAAAFALMLVWLVGVAWRATRLWRDGRWAARLRRSSREIDEPRVLEILKTECRRLRIAHRPQLLSTDVAVGVLLVGVFRPAIILPAAIRPGLSDRELALALRHELAHVRRRDLLWNWLAIAVDAALFFHPLLPMARRQWRLAQERACDELVLARDDDRAAEYGELLIRIAAWAGLTRTGKSSALGVLDSPCTLRERLTAMIHHRHPSRRTCAIAAVALAAAAVFGMLPWRLVAQDRAKEAPATDHGLKFGPVIELTINDDDPRFGNFLADLDAGKVFSPPPDFSPADMKAAMQWMADNGVDAFGESYGLLGIDFIALPTSESNWDRVHPRILNQVDAGKPGTPVPLTGHRDSLPATYLFKTREGGKGVLQILSFNERVKDEKPSSTTIRYKLLKQLP